MHAAYTAGVSINFWNESLPFCDSIRKILDNRKAVSFRGGLFWGVCITLIRRVNIASGISNFIIL